MSQRILGRSAARDAGTQPRRNSKPTVKASARRMVIDSVVVGDRVE
jgi:hypothetical protein